MHFVSLSDVDLLYVNFSKYLFFLGGIFFFTCAFCLPQAWTPSPRAGEALPAPRCCRSRGSGTRCSNAGTVSEDAILEKIILFLYGTSAEIKFVCLLVPDCQKSPQLHCFTLFIIFLFRIKLLLF